MSSIYSNSDYEDDYQGLLEVEHYIQKSKGLTRQPFLCSMQVPLDVECEEDPDAECYSSELEELPPFTPAQLKRMWAKTPYFGVEQSTSVPPGATPYEAPRRFPTEKARLLWNPTMRKHRERHLSTTSHIRYDRALRSYRQNQAPMSPSLLNYGVV